MEDVLLFMPSMPFHTFVRLSFTINVSVSVCSLNLSNAKYLTHNHLLLCFSYPTCICKLQASLSHLMLQIIRIIDVCIDIYVIMSSDLYGTCSTWKSLVTAFTGQTLPQGGTHAHVYIRITMVTNVNMCHLVAKLVP